MSKCHGIVRFAFILGITAMGFTVEAQPIPVHPINPPVIIQPPIFIRMPDLVVSQARVIGRITVSPDSAGVNVYRIPVMVRVRNQGTAAAPIFKMAASYSHPSMGTVSYVLPFSVPGQSSQWYPFTRAPLSANGTVDFYGVLVYRDYRNLNQLNLTFEADSCSGDEFQPSYCRAREWNESNNTLALSVTL